MRDRQNVRSLGGAAAASPERQVPGRHFDDQYAEEVILSDGQKVLLRLLQPGDKELVRGALPRCRCARAIGGS